MGGGEPVAIQKVFQRYEKKYLLTEEQCAALKAAIPAYMNADQYGLHTICNVYYDTDRDDLIRASIEKPVYKEKFRLRSYGIPGGEDIVFLEMKKKYKGVVYKRRVAAPYDRAMEYLSHIICRDGGEDIPEDRDRLTDSPVGKQILNEISFMIRRYHLHPRIYIAYDRIAYYGKENPDIRLTIDSDMRFREENLNLAAGDAGTPILPETKYLMEIKIPDAMPLWLTEILTREQIYPVSFSKYGTYYSGRRYRQENGGEKNDESTI